MNQVVAEPISRAQYFFLLAMALLAGGVYIWPQSVVLAAGQNAPYAIVASGALAATAVWLKTSWAGFAAGDTYVSALRNTWGRVLMWPILAVFLVLQLILAMTLLALFGQLMGNAFFQFSSQWLIKAVIAGTAGWIASKSLNVLARNVQFWYMVMLVLTLVLTAMGLRDASLWTSIWPTAPFRLSPILFGILNVWYLWAEFGLITTLARHVRGTTLGQIRTIALGVIAMQTGILLVLFVLTEASLGPQALEALQWPLVFVFSNIDVSDFFISRIGGLVTIIWTAGMTFNLAIHIFSFSMNLQEALGFSELGRKWVVGAVTVLVWAGAAEIYTPMLASMILTDIVNVGDLAATLTIMALAVVVAWIGSHRRAKKQYA